MTGIIGSNGAKTKKGKKHLKKEKLKIRMLYLNLEDLGPERKAETIASNSLVLSLETDEGSWATGGLPRDNSSSVATPT